MNQKVVFHDLGIIEYKAAWDIQENLLAGIVSLKDTARNKMGTELLPVNHLLFCEHPSVYTIGKSGSEKNLLIGMNELEKQNISVFRTNRGGDITYHGPGQIVGYPIIDLEQFKLSIKEYIHLLEESIIQTLLVYGIHAGRLPNATGVWLEPENKTARKICAMGVRTSRFVTMHGFALNVNTDLKYFSYINPCGFIDKAVTSMQKETEKEWDIESVKIKLKEKLSEIFQMTIVK